MSILGIERDPFPPRQTNGLPELRLDGWQNPYLGFGTARDKISHGFGGWSPQLTDAELSNLFYTDDVSAKLVDKRPEEAFRRGYKLCSKSNPEGAAKLQEAGRALFVDAKVQESATWGRLYGGSVLFVGALGGSPETPLDPRRTREVRFLNVLDRRYVGIEKWYEDPLSPKYGEPELYRIAPMTQRGGRAIRVHESRIIRFDGQHVDLQKKWELGGWTYSVLQRPYDVIRTFATAFQAAGLLTSDASQAVFTMKGLFEMIASGEKGRLQQRMQLVDMSRSAGRAILLDSDGERFERVPTNFSGIPEMLDRMMMRLASSVDMPVTILMGRSPAGQNATGESDFTHWYDSIRSQQVKEYAPKLLKLYQILSSGRIPDLEIEWHDLEEPNEKEEAEIEKLEADTFAVYIDRGVLLPEQVTLAKFGSIDHVEIDEDALRESLAQEKDFSKQLETARGALGEKELAALSIAQGADPAASPADSPAAPAAEPNGQPQT